MVLRKLRIFASFTISSVLIVACGKGLYTKSSSDFSPRIDTISPTFSTGAGGGTLTLSGKFLNTANTVTIGNAACDIVTESLTSITCVIPANTAGTSLISAQTVTVKSLDKTSNNDKQLTYLGDISLWLDANDGTTFTLNSSDVTQWSDKSGNAMNASGGIAPTRVLDNQDGKYYVSFNGTDQWLNIPQGTWGNLTNNLESTTVIAVLKPRALGSAPSGGVSYRGAGVIGDAAGYFGLYLSDVGIAPGIDGTVNRTTPTMTITPNQTVIAITTLDVNGLNISGTDLIPATTTPGIIKPGGSSTASRLGKCYDSFNQYYNGNIGEILIFKRKLSETEIKTILVPLKSNWSL